MASTGPSFGQNAEKRVRLCHPGRNNKVAIPHSLAHTPAATIRLPGPPIFRIVRLIYATTVARTRIATAFRVCIHLLTQEQRCPCPSPIPRGQNEDSRSRCLSWIYISGYCWFATPRIPPRIESSSWQGFLYPRSPKCI